MDRSRGTGGRTAAAGAALLLLVLVCAPIAPPPAYAQAAPSSCPDILPLSMVREGMTGVGFSVRRGTTPEAFAIEVLGVLDDAIAPGRDMILVETSGPPIDAAGGIWFGMSGSPVYVEGRLLGAVSFGFSGTSTVAGLTPAADLLRVLDGGGPASAGKVATSARVTEAVRQATRVDGVLTPLKTPLAVSGVPARGMELLAEVTQRAGLDVLPYTAARARSQLEADPSEVVPGGNYAAAVAAGDVTIGALGTTSAVCDGAAVAFGHPAFFTGDTSMAAFTAEALTIIEDPVFGPFKMGNLLAPVGTVSQDRLAGVGGPLGPPPATSPVSSTVTSADTDVTRSGRTDVYAPEFLGDVAFFHTFSNIDSVVDRIGPGTADLAFSITGRRADGTDFSLRRENRTASIFDIAFDGIADLPLYLALLANSGIEDVQLTSTDVDVDVTATVSQYTIVGAQVSVDGGPAQPIGSPETGSFVEIPLVPGATLTVDVDLQPYRATGTTTQSVTLEVPEDLPAGFGMLLIQGGPGSTDDPFACLFDPAACPGQATSFDGLLQQLQDRPRNDDLVVQVEVFPEGEPVPVPEPPAGAGPLDDGIADGGVVASTRLRLDRPVTGELVAPVTSGVAGGGLTRVFGSDRVETAVALSQLAFGDPGSVATAVIAGARAEADALVSAPLAASVGGPVLLTPTDALAPVVEEELARLGVVRAIIVGGTAVVADSVAAALGDAGIEVERIAGADRYATAARVAGRLDEPSVYVAGGDASIDAAAVSGLAAMQRAPILLAAGDRLTDATLQRLAGRHRVTIVGGTTAVPASVAQALAARGLAVDRLAGATRYDTSARVAERSVEAGADPLRLLLTTGRSVPDALVAGPVAASMGGRVLLVDGQGLGGSPASRDLLGELVGAPVSVVLVGGATAIAPSVEEELATLLLGGEPRGEG